MRYAIYAYAIAGTLFFGHTLGQVADHYDYLARVYVAGLAAADHAVMICNQRKQSQ